MTKKRPKIVSHRPRIIDHTPVVFRFPRCEANITSEQTLNWRDGNERQIRKAERLGVGLFQCFQSGTYEIDGHWFCRKHAGLIALDLLAEDAE